MSEKVYINKKFEHKVEVSSGSGVAATFPADFTIQSASSSSVNDAVMIKNSNGDELLKLRSDGVSYWNLQGTPNRMLITTTYLHHNGYFRTGATSKGINFNGDEDLGFARVQQGASMLYQPNSAAPATLNAFQGRGRVCVTSQGSGRVAVGYGCAQFNAASALTPKAELTVTGRVNDNSDALLDLLVSDSDYTGGSRKTVFGVTCDGVRHIVSFSKNSLPPTTPFDSNTVGIIFVPNANPRPTICFAQGGNWIDIQTGVAVV